MDNPENTERAITNGQSREYRGGNHKWTIQRIPRGQSQMDNPEKLATWGTQDEDKQSKKHNAIHMCLRQHYTLSKHK